MRKLGFMAAAAGLILSGSLAKADFVFSAQSQPGPTIGTQATTIYDFFVNNDGTHSTGTGINSIDIAIYSPSGVYIGVRTGLNAGKPDVFYTASGSAQDSWISDEFGATTSAPPITGNGGNLTNKTGGNVLAFGANPATTGGTADSNTGFTANQLVGGIAGTIFSTAGADPTPLYFARAVVPAGATAVLLENPGGTASAPTSNASRVFEPNSGVLSPGTGNFAATNDSGTSGPFNAVPEPASFGLLTVVGLGLVARRRRA